MNRAYTAQCPGPNTAKRNWVCFYEGQRNAATLGWIYDRGYNSLAVDRWGTRMHWKISGPGSYADGHWVARGR